ncbi:phage tail tape measure protein [Xanthomonas citri]|uniref:phage tail tape measure protein n=1 Tax=Xanthomonas citri TaxID=346 RepID=UPI0001CED389|nr:phage tail tape measure protein [Xanthomonas citri]EFF47875.1 phage hk97 tail length tape measure-related protein [Xanthomonas citri pv. aurantifolii str. ICPB 10535]MCC8492132.1 phage tail tape measure protein [Xanthomonas citri pv. fuscans]
MTDANLGTARIDILIDTASMNAGISDAKNRVSSMGAEFEARFEKMSQAEKRATLEVLKFNDSLGRTREEMKLLNAGARGAAPEALEQLRTTLLKQRQEMDAGGISAKAYTAAMRGVPAQITDIAVSLQGGQQPLTVLLQQGGQLKDMFGGIVPAAKALGSSLLGLVNPYTVTAAAIAAVSYAAYEADDVQDRFAQALVKSGNIAASTAGEMQKLTGELQRSSNIGASTAAEAVEKAVASGQIGARNLTTVSRAAGEAATVLGASVQDVVDNYVKLGDKPLETLLALNKTENFLTAAQYERIRALEEEGNKQAAANEAIQIYSDHQQSVIQQVRENYSESKRLWEDLKTWIDQSTASVGKFVNALNLTDGVAQVTRAFADGSAFDVGKNFSGTTDSRRQAREAVEAAKKQEQDFVKLRGLEAEAQADRLKSAQTNRDFDAQTIKLAEAKLTLEQRIAQMKEKANAAGVDSVNIARRENALREEDARKKAKKPVSTAGASRSASLQGFTDDQTEERARISADTKVLQAEFQARQVSAEAYYSRMRELAEQNTSTDARTITSQIEYLRAQAVSGKDAINVNKQIGELEAKLAKVRIDGAAAQQTLTTQEKVAIESRNAGVRSYASALDASTDALQQQMDAMVAKVGMGDREYEIQEKVNDVYREQAKRLTELALQKTADPANAKAYDEEIAAVRAATETRVAIIRSGYQSMAEAQANWVNGAKSSWANYADDAQNIAGQSASLFDNLFGGMEDALVQFTTKGKVDFKSLANSIIADMARIAAKQAIVGALGSLFGGLGGGAGAAGSTFVGQASTGAGSNYNFGSNVGQFTGGGWASGGYTGDGAKYDKAGYVHRGEYVINAESTRRIGRGYLDQLNGYANGGMVGGSGGAGLISTPNVNITVNGAPSEPEVNVTQGKNGLDIEVAFGQFERRLARGVADGSSPVGTAFKRRYNVREAV